MLFDKHQHSYNDLMTFWMSRLNHFLMTCHSLLWNPKTPLKMFHQSLILHLCQNHNLCLCGLFTEQPIGNRSSFNKLLSSLDRCGTRSEHFWGHWHILVSFSFFMTLVCSGLMSDDIFLLSPGVPITSSAMLFGSTGSAIVLSYIVYRFNKHLITITCINIIQSITRYYMSVCAKSVEMFQFHKIDARS
ncbi:hypothetical protein AGLY_010486 [Aphis glycines]|uniref:Uncharacterized protein n=1 Tax=Aphis glycines TaxID=307491 RepID=A0A6G0TF11_APHGL|nr:hypothetical protein AGLY_010486 [Aphis glycines]